MISFSVDTPLLILGGKTRTAPFEVTNTSDVPVEITHVETPLSAVTVALTAPLSVEAGTTVTGDLQVISKTTAAPGRRDIPVIIRYTEFSENKVKQGEVPGIIAYDSGTVEVQADAMWVVENEPGTAYVNVKNKSGVPIAVRDISYVGEDLEISGPLEVTTIGANDEADVAVAVEGNTVGVYAVDTLGFMYVVTD